MNHRSRRLCLVSSIAVAIGFVWSVSGPAALAAGNGGAVRPSTITAKILTLPSQSVTTTTGKKLDLRIQATADQVLQGHASVLVQLANIPTTGGATTLSNKSFEIFSWTFSLSGAAFSASSSSATVSVPSSKIGWYGSMSLRFAPSSHKAERCTTGSAILYTGTITGSFDFNSTQKPNSGWGGVHDSGVSWKNAQLEISDDCEAKVAPLACTTGYIWTSPSESLGGMDSQEFGGEKSSVAGTSSSQSFDFLWVQRNETTEVDGTMVQRGDYESDPGTSSLSGTQVVSAKPASDSTFTGSASLRLSTPALKQETLSTGACKGAGGKTESGCDTVYGPGKSGSATWTNGNPALVAKLTIGGNATEPDKTATGYTGGSIDILGLGKCKS